MAIYRIVTRMGQESDCFLEANSEDEAKQEFSKKNGWSLGEFSVTLTSFARPDEKKLYLVGLAPRHIGHGAGRHVIYFAVQAVKGGRAVSEVMTKEAGRHGTYDTLADVKYVGRIDPNGEDIVKVLNSD